MMDGKAMAKPMASNLNLLSDASSETVDVMMYHQMTHSLMCHTNTRPDTYFGVNNLRKLLMDLRHAHLVENHVVRCLKGIVEYGLKYDKNQRTNLHHYVDSDWEGSAIEKKNTLGFFFSLRSSIFYWFGRTRSYMALSKTKEKYVATCLDIWEVVCFF